MGQRRDATAAVVELNKHKSWVCRRLALLERLGGEAQAEMRLGLLSVGLARQLTRLPTGNQSAILSAARRESLTTVEVQGLIDLLRGATPEQEQLLLDDPRAALLQAEGVPNPARDPRLSPAELLTGKPHPHWVEMLGYTRFSRN